MVHPRPATAARAALYGYLIGRAHDAEALPPLVREFEAFKAGRRERVPDVPFQMLTALDLGAREWAAIAANASWQMTRMNLNTFARHGVFEDGEAHRWSRTGSRTAAIARARVFPYQLLAAYASADRAVPRQVLRRAPGRDGDRDRQRAGDRRARCTSARTSPARCSRRSPGTRQGATTAVRCMDVAALVAAAILRRNPDAEVLPFEEDVVHVRLNPRDTVMTNADGWRRSAAAARTGAPLARLNERRDAGDLVIFVSDNESWVDAAGGRGTATMEAWNVFRRATRERGWCCSTSSRPRRRRPWTRGRPERGRVLRPGVRRHRRLRGGADGRRSLGRRD